MLHALNNQSLKLLKQFNQSLKSILGHDFRTNQYHQAFVDKLLQYFQSNNQNAIYIGIIGFHQLSKHFMLEIIAEKVKPYNLVFDVFNNYFLAFLDNCTDFNNNFQNMLLYKIIKIFLKSIRFFIPSSIQDNTASYEHWQRIVERSITTVFTETQLRNPVVLKVRKISFEAILRLYEKTRNLLKGVTKENEFYEYLYKFQSRNFFNLFKDSYEKSITMQYHLYDYCLSCIYKMFQRMLSGGQYNSEIIDLFSKAEVREKLIKDSVLSDGDIDYWYSLPKEYIINQSTIAKYLQNKRYLACEFFNELISYKSMNNATECPLFKELIVFLLQLLQINEAEKDKEAAELSSAPQSSEYDLIKKNKIHHHKIKEGILNILEKVKGKILRNAPDLIEQLISKFVVNEFNSRIGFLRERACSFIKEYKHYHIKDESLLIVIIQKLCFILENDKELPVKTMSALTLPLLIKRGNVRSMLVANLKPMMMIYLKLIEEIEHVELILSINTILKLLKNEIKEYLLSLCEFFAQYFLRESKREQDKDQESVQCSDISFVLDNVLHMFLSIIKYFDLEDDLFHKIELIIINVLQYCFSVEGNEHIEEGLSLIICLLEKRNQISMELWSLYKAILFSTFDSYNYDYQCFEENITAACYFIAKDTPTFLNTAQNNYLQITLDFFDKATTAHHNSSEKLRYIYQIINMILECSRGKVDDVFIKVVQYIREKVPTAKLFHMNNLSELLSSCIIYNTDYCLNVFEEDSTLLNFYFSNLNKVSYTGETKRHLLALCSIAVIPREKQKAFIFNKMKMIVEAIVSFGVKNLTRNDDELDKDALDDDSDLSNEDNETINECINNEKYNIANLANVNNITKTVNQFDQIFGDKNNVDKFFEEEEEEEEEEEDFLYSELSCLLKLTDLGKANEGEVISRTLSEMNKIYPNDFEALMKMISKELFDTLGKLIQQNKALSKSN